jgi:hypothetical protein
MSRKLVVVAQLGRRNSPSFMEAASTTNSPSTSRFVAVHRGYVYERPDLGLKALHSGATTHWAQPFAGIVFRS